MNNHELPCVLLPHKRQSRFTEIEWRKLRISESRKIVKFVISEFRKSKFVKFVIPEIREIREIRDWRFSAANTRTTR